jgi:translation elongation factor EF-Ts
MTGLSIMQCKKALEEVAGDISKAIILTSNLFSEGEKYNS